MYTGGTRRQGLAYRSTPIRRIPANVATNLGRESMRRVWSRLYSVREFLIIKGTEVGNRIQAGVRVTGAVRSFSMQPTTPRDFLKVALQRLTAAEEIMEALRLTLEAQYIGGYTVECSVKALILETTSASDRPAIRNRLTHGANYHRAEVLLDRLRERGIFLTADIAKRMRRFDWTTDLRYEIGGMNANDIQRAYAQYRVRRPKSVVALILCPPANTKRSVCEGKICAPTEETRCSSSGD